MTDHPVDELARGHEPMESDRAAPRPWQWTLAASLVVGVLAVAARQIGARSSYNIFIDEATYADISRSVGAGTGMLLHGEPFTLHPPLGFVVLGAAARNSGVNDLAGLILALRPLVGVLGGVVAVVLTLMLRASGYKWAAAAGGLLLALDAFAINFDSRVMLEAIAQLFAISTIAGATMLARPRSEVPWLWIAATALAGAATFAVKETFGLVVVAALLLAALIGSRLARRRLLVTAAGALIGYAIANLAVILAVGVDVWWASRLEGLTRLLGTYQPTGFNAPDSEVTLWSRIGPNAAEYGLTYILLLAGGLSGATLVLLTMRRASKITHAGAHAQAGTRVIGSWAVASCGYVAYAVLFGSLEEQMFYIALAPSVAALVALVGLMVGVGGGRRVAAAAIVLALLAQSTVWAYVRANPDDVYGRLLAWLPGNVEAGSTLGVTEETAQFLLEGYELGEWNSFQEFSEHQVDYVLVSDNLAAQGYGLADTRLTDEIARRGSLVFSAVGRESDLKLYDIRAAVRGAS